MGDGGSASSRASSNLRSAVTALARVRATSSRLADLFPLRAAPAAPRRFG
jgi:hypothetical protein